jgi:hypothetical protein
MATPAPIPDEDSLENLVADPEKTRRLLDDLHDREAQGELTTYSHEEVVKRLAELGVQRSPEL